jgi:hypothetical protein
LRPDCVSHTREAPLEAETGGKSLGVYLGLQTDLGDFNDSANDYINIRAQAGYLNSFGDIDLFCGAVYTFGFDDPGLSPVVGRPSLPPPRRAGLEANIAYNAALSENFTLALALDSQNQFDFTRGAALSGEKGAFAVYAVLEPALRLSYALPFGEADVSNSFPFSWADGKALDYILSLSLNTDAGLGVAAGFTWRNLWAEKDSGGEEASLTYGQTEVVAHFWRGAFFVSLAATADGGFGSFGLEPYAAYTIGPITVFASVLLSNLGAEPDEETARLNLIWGKRDITSVIPSIGVRARL